MANVSITNTDSQLSGKTLVTAEGDWTITGQHSYNRSPSAPFVVQSGSAKVTNLDADKLDGLDWSTAVFTGDVLFTDATYDIGKSGATRPRDLFLSRNLTVGGTSTLSGNSSAIFICRSNIGVAGGNTDFYGAGYDSGIAGAETDVKFPCPAAGTIKNLYVSADGAISGANTATFTCRKNGVDQTVTCVVTGGVLVGNDTTHSFTVAAGDLIAVKLVTSASAETRKWVVAFQLVTT